MAKQNEESIVHFGLVRLRVTGTGNLKMRLISLGGNRTYTMVPLVMADPTDIEPVRLCNLTQQRAQLELKITEIDESFVISKIIVFAKGVASSYPGN